MVTLARRKAFISESTLAVAVGLALIIGLGTFLRMYHLDYRTMGHIEMYAPNIPLPEGISDPPPRLTLVKTITGTLWEPHPPFWYILMYPYTRLFGASLFALRFPSVVFGMGAVLLIYLLGAALSDRKTGLLAAALLAFNGHQILWSQISRPYILSVFLGLAATILLLQIIRSGSRSWFPLFLYLSISALGLGTIYYYWPFFITQILWVLILGFKDRHPELSLFRWQILVLLLLSPLITIAIFQSRESYLSGNILAFLGDYIKFGFAFEPDLDAAIQSPLPALVMAIIPLVALLLFVIGSVNKVKVDDRAASTPRPAPTLRMLAVVAGMIFLAMIAIAVALGPKIPIRTRPMLFSSILPLAIIGIVTVLHLSLPVQERIRALIGGFAVLRKPWSLILFQATLPILAIAFVSLFVPFFASRQAMTYTPYFLILLAAGCSALIPAARRAAPAAVYVVLILGLAWIQSASIRYSFSRPVSPVDYQGLAQRWMGEINSTDLIFIQRHWATTPIFYYLDSRDYHFVGGNYTQVEQKNPNSRVWVFKLDSLPTSVSIQDALSGYKLVDTVKAFRDEAELYERQSSADISIVQAIQVSAGSK